MQHTFLALTPVTGAHAHQSVPTDAPSHMCHTNSHIVSQLVPINVNKFLADITNGHYFI